MKIGVIGAGTMGQGIAKAFAQVEGNTVALCDIKQEWAENGLAKIKKGYEKLVAKGKMTQEKADAIVAAITPGLKEDLCADCDLVVEAAFEDMKVKQTTFGELDKICKPECIFASNTSSLSITEIGKGVSRPLVGMHFFNPADRMKLIEVIAGCNTPAETVEKIKEISVAIGKQPVQVNEAAGFVVNRILIPMINEAAFIKMEGVSDIAGIDTAMKLGANHPYIPCDSCAQTDLSPDGAFSPAPSHSIYLNLQKTDSLASILYVLQPDSGWILSFLPDFLLQILRIFLCQTTYSIA